VVVSSLFRRTLLFQLRKMSTFFFTRKMSYESGIIKREFFFCAPPLGLLFRSYLLAFAFLCSLVLARLFDRLFLRAALGERERERKRERAFVAVG
jgi:hypothetical protein